MFVATLKKITLFAASAAALVLAVSCSGLALPATVFSASIEEMDIKSQLVDRGKVNWEETDHVCINSSLFSVKPKNPATDALLILESGQQPPVAPFAAIYPSSLYVDGKYILPDTQIYSEGKINAPMYATSNSLGLTFRNICGVVCLNITGEDKIKSITVKTNSAGERISGEFFIVPGTDDKMMMQPSYGRTVTIDCGEGVQLNMSTAKQFYFFFPPATYSAGLNFTAVNSNNKSYVLTTEKATNIMNNCVYNFYWELM